MSVCGVSVCGPLKANRPEETISERARETETPSQTESLCSYMCVCVCVHVKLCHIDAGNKKNTLVWLSLSCKHTHTHSGIMKMWMEDQL